MSATSDYDGKSVSSMVSETNFLVGASEDFDFDIRHFDFSHFLLRSIDDKELLGNGPFILCSCKEYSVSWNLQGFCQVVAKPICFPVGQRDFSDGKPAFVVHVN